MLSIIKSQIWRKLKKKQRNEIQFENENTFHLKAYCFIL